ncbi:hypothetical protein Kpho02_35590 [Kitasatospora phosalacinea]|uniref:Adhesin domain-containing protein n=1 Tax=Kitasatospora phosalacinea TaxID=2065 RepID=A0A9W6Q7D3_9ACTN|nr:hypothetical protein [Kitasatospora phosalacinea]GLW71260.1 hypothetical protein Kpho02_35590 [Kitasatospora phosalacinea]
MKRWVGAVAVVGLLAGGAVGCGPWDDRKRTVSYEVPGQVTELQVDGEVGGIEVRAGDGPVQVVEKRTWRDEEPRAAHVLAGGVLKLSYSCSQCGIGYQVRVPAGTVLRLKETTGGIRLHGLSGDVTAETVTGGVEATGLRSANVVLKAETGGVTARFEAAPARAELRTGTGGVELTVPAGQAYAVDAHAATGGTEVNVPSQAGAAHALVARADTGGVKVSAD